MTCEQAEEAARLLPVARLQNTCCSAHGVREPLDRLVERADLLRLGVDAAGRVFLAPEGLELGQDQRSPVQPLRSGIDAPCGSYGSRSRIEIARSSPFCSMKSTTSWHSSGVRVS